MEGLERPAQTTIQGHEVFALERFMDVTHHMIEFDVLTHDSPVGEKGGKMRLFLSDEGYEKALATEKHGDIKIRKHARVIEEHIFYDKKNQQYER
jgi:hypothetical protein